MVINDSPAAASYWKAIEVFSFGNADVIANIVRAPIKGMNVRQ